MSDYNCQALEKDPQENVTLTFDFSPALRQSETITAINSIVVTVIAGVDPAPGLILNGPAAVSLDGMSVLQPIKGGIDGVSYSVVVAADTSATPTPQRLIIKGLIGVFAQ